MNEQEPQPVEPTTPAEAAEAATEPQPTQDPEPTPDPEATPEPGSTPAPTPTPEPAREIVAESAAVAPLADPSRIRRAPRFGSFLFVGLFLAVLVSGLLSFVRDSTLDPEVVAARALDSWGIFWLLLIFLGATSALLSYGVAVWFDRRSLRALRSGRR